MDPPGHSYSLLSPSHISSSRGPWGCMWVHPNKYIQVHPQPLRPRDTHTVNAATLACAHIQSQIDPWYCAHPLFLGASFYFSLSTCPKGEGEMETPGTSGVRRQPCTPHGGRPPGTCQKTTSLVSALGRLQPAAPGDADKPLLKRQVTAQSGPPGRKSHDGCWRGKKHHVVLGCPWRR